MLTFSATKEYLFLSSGDKTGNVQTGVDHVKKTFCRLAGPADGGVQMDCLVFRNTSDRAIFGADRLFNWIQIAQNEQYEKVFQGIFVVFLSVVRSSIMVHNVYWVH
jgi:hypothetical protein